MPTGISTFYGRNHFKSFRIFIILNIIKNMNLKYIHSQNMNKSYKVLIIKKTAWVLFLSLAVLLFLSCENEESVPPLELTAEIKHVSEYGGSDGSIKLTVTGGLEPYAFLWSTGDTTKDLTGIQAGIYNVAVTDQAPQSVTDTFVVTQPALEGVMDVVGNIYNIIEIGEQTWIQENLRVTHTPDGSAISGYAYIDNEDSIAKYGLLYTWDVAMNGSKEEGAQGICPDGWHLPSDDEWKQLEKALGMTQAEANMVNTWRGSPVGTMMLDGGESGYEAQLAGRRSSSGGFSLMGRMEYMWTSTEYTGTLAWRRCLDAYSTAVGRWNTFPKSYGFSVRCVKDD